jgi:sugar lactone lactonase YvrE
MRFRSSFILLLLVCALAVSIQGSGPTFWTVATASEFLKGTSDGVYVSLSGTLTAGPQLSNRLSSAPAQVWGLSQAADGTLWAGTGADGRLIRLRSGQPEETVFDSSEQHIFAVYAAGNRVFAASSPEGKVYVIEGNNAARVFFDPAEKYIWALVVDAGGRLWVGAGNPAVIYRVAQDGSNQIVYRPPAAHVVSLATDSTGRVLAGTESPGRLYRFDAQDRPFVMLDSGLTELGAISAGPNGVIFAAAVAKGDQASGEGEAASVAVTLASSSAPAGPAASEASESTATQRRSVLYRIDPDGTWEETWSTPDLVYDILAQQDGGVLVATGPDGRLYRVERGRDVLLLTGVDAHQITQFAHAGGSSSASSLSAFATANPGRVMSLGTAVQSPARYLSAVQDTKSVATWGLIRWEAAGPVALYSRSGNTQRPDDSWSDWAGPYTRREGEQVTSPAARFVQWRAVFTDPAATPAASGAPGRASLTAVTLAYLPRNNRPVVNSITVHPPGVVFQRPFVNDESAIAGLDDDTAESRRPPGDTARPTPAPGRRMFQKGLQTLAWRAEDSDSDRLDYTLQYRREGETVWRVLRSGLTDSIFVWDTTTVADGRYVVRVQASDKAANVGDRALVGERDSDIVEVDNTPPAIELTLQGTPPTRIAVRVTDSRSPIQKVEYSVSGGPWQLVYPTDGLADSPAEQYEIPITGIPSNQVVVRATDTLQNVVAKAAP